MHRFGLGAGQKGGELTGPDPTNRARPGTKRHLLTDAQGIPLALELSGANRNDCLVFESLIDAIPPIRNGRRGRPQRRPAKLHADKAYDHRRCRRALRTRNILARIARRGVDSSERLGRHRWVIERTLAWLGGFHKLLIRYERTATMHEALTMLGVCAITARFVERLLGHRPGEAGAARAAMCSDRGAHVGRVLLIEHASRKGERVRRPGDRTTRGLWNLNFYVRDLRARCRELQRLGFEFWADPVAYHLGPKAGVATEAMFEGSDAVAINLVEPDGDESTFTGRIKGQLERYGRTPTGFTAVATTANCVADLSLARAFYEQVLGMRVVLDEILGKPETNRFLARPVDARTHTVFLSGSHFFGKVSLNQPMNWAAPNRVERAFAPAIGYLAQGFVIETLGDAANAVARAGVLDAHRIELDGLPDLDGYSALQVRVPGSGANVVLAAPRA